jgi:hypothetical protein
MYKPLPKRTTFNQLRTANHVDAKAPEIHKHYGPEQTQANDDGNIYDISVWISTGWFSIGETDPGNDT